MIKLIMMSAMNIDVQEYEICFIWNYFQILT